MNKGNIFLVGMLVATALPFLVHSTQTALSQSNPQSIEVALGEIAPIGGEVTFYTLCS